MNILVVSQYFWPEPFIINQLSLKLAEQGHQVTVLTGKPNYPDGDIYSGYKSGGVVRERMQDAVNVIRVPLRPRYAAGGKNLVLNYLSFVLSGLAYFPWLVRGKKFDVIFVFAPSPITMAIPAILLKWIKRAPLAIWVQDLWPESLSATGFVRNKFILRLVGLMVKGIYRCADTLLVQSRAFTEPVSRFAPLDKIRYYPNSIEDQLTTDSVNNVTELPVDLVELLESRFCLVFAGNIGKAQSVETILGAARQLSDLEDIRIILVGSGSMLDWAKSEVSKHQLSNIVFAGRFPMQVMPEIFSRSQGLIVTLKDEEIFSYTIPSKIQAYLSSGRPVVCAMNGEGARVIQEASAGLTASAEDPDGLAKAVRSLYGMSAEERVEMGRLGRDYFLENFELNKLSSELIDLLSLRMKQQDSTQ